MFYRSINVTNIFKNLSSLFFSTIILLGFQFSIVSAQDLPPAQIYVQQENRHNGLGEIAHIDINFSPGIAPFETAGFELLLSYDPNTLSIISITQGELLDSCQWEIFMYSQDSLADCGGEPCPEGMIRIIALADDFTFGSPLCNISTAGTLVNIDFEITSDSAFECFFAPVDFYWYDCGDNSLSSILDDTTFISKDVYHGRYQNQDYYKITKDTTFPTPFGASSECTISSTPPQRRIDFISFGVDITCNDVRDYKGDINLNDIPYEIADAVLFSNYFFFGLDIFTVDLENQIKASDVNADSLTLTLDDYIYLLRVIHGEVLPFPSPPSIAAVDTVQFFQDTLNKKISMVYPDSLRGIYLIFEGDLRPWGWGDDTTETPLPFNGTHTRVLQDIYLHGDTVFSQDSLFYYTGEGKLVGAFASYDGITSLPTTIDGGSGSCCENRGNIDGDVSGEIDISDLVSLVSYQFATGTAPPCLDEADVSADWSVDIVDIIFLVNYMFNSGPPPQPCQ